MMHLGTLANSGAGLLVIEATAVERQGRITHGCTGLYSDANEQAMKRVIDACRRFGTAKIGIQLGHSGRKGSATRPWEGQSLTDPLTVDAWPTKSASALPFGPGWHVPAAMTEDDIAGVTAAFVAATRRANRIGLDLIEVHAAHGYLLHQFLSPYSNKRTDRYGGSLENRMRFPLEVFAAMRAAWPEAKPLGARVSAVDWIDGGQTIEDMVAFSSALKMLGCDFVDVTTGGIDPNIKVPVGPAFQVPFADRIRREASLPTMAVGMITDAEQADAIVREGKADLVALARGFLDDPHWGWHAAYKLGAEVAMPPQYRRAGLKLWAPAQRHSAKA
jgi:2,4-dienoyl-CoA reductase-like NADH-dependent reductase (Old Yellow Enzyme family)